VAQLPDGNGPAYEGLRERVSTALLLDSESPSVEFKSGIAWDSLKIDIIKTVLAMSNLRDGGLIIVGHTQAATMTEGMAEGVLATYDPDIMLDQCDEYASPRAVISMARMNIGGNNYIAIEVSEFDEDPVICKKGYHPDLKRGGVYIRPLTGRPRSSIVSDAQEMRAVLELAIDKGISNFETRAVRRGYVSTPRDSEAYRAEQTDLDDA
jgi:predicted HTH transcriptional regulator